MFCDPSPELPQEGSSGERAQGNTLRNKGKKVYPRAQRKLTFQNKFPYLISLVTRQVFRSKTFPKI